MIYLKRFNESIDNDLLDIKDIFQDIVDLKYDTFEFRNGDGTKYQKIFDVEFKITKGENILVNILSSLHCYYSIEQDIKKEIVPILKKMGFKPTVSSSKTKQLVCYKVPISGKSETGHCWDPIYKISVLLKPTF